MKQIRVEEYQQADRNSPYRDWFDGLSAQHAAKVGVALLRLSQGNTSAIKWFDGLGELRIDWGPGLRVYLVQADETLIILFGGGTKSSQKADIRFAKTLLEEYRSRRRTERKQANTRS